MKEPTLVNYYNFSNKTLSKGEKAFILTKDKKTLKTYNTLPLLP